ncbi:MAG: hypothetical protein QOG67_3389 [Verrucomicrobiota bacterium]
MLTLTLLMLVIVIVLQSEVRGALTFNPLPMGR